MYKSHLIAALSNGIAIGACAREVVRTASPVAFAEGQKRYRVLDGHVDEKQHERELNEFTSQGWHYVGAIPQGTYPGKLVFER